MFFKDGFNIIYIDGGSVGFGNDFVGDFMRVVIGWVFVRDING